jgi:hypothetical protein
MAAMGAIQAGAGIIGGLGAADAAKKAAERQAALVKMQRQEEIRQTRDQFRMELGGGRLASFASNLQMSGSTLGYLGMLESEQIRQLNYQYNAMLAEQRAIRAGAAGAGTDLIIGGIAAGLQAGIGAYSQWQGSQPAGGASASSVWTSAPPARDFYADAGLKG